MPQKLLYDVSQLDPGQVAFSIEEIRKVNPHRHEFEQLTAILLFRPEEKLIVGLRELRHDEFWVRGHIPGRPLFPGSSCSRRLPSSARFIAARSSAEKGSSDLEGSTRFDSAGS